MGDVIVLGGGLAGLACAVALGQSGHRVRVVEARAFPGGRASSYELPAENGGEIIDNCQHILLKCCVNLLDFYDRLGVRGKIAFHDRYYFLEPGGRVSTFHAGALPAPLHFSESFAALQFLNFGEKIQAARALLAIRRERKTRGDLDRITMRQWLAEKRQGARVIGRFWAPILVSAINEDLDRMAAAHGFQVFWLAFLAARDTYHMGIPSVPLGELYGLESWRSAPGVEFHFRTKALRLRTECGVVAGIETGAGLLRGDQYVCALPFERAGCLAPELELDLSAFEHSPITGIHLWFDRPVTVMPHAVLLDATVQWMFNKGEGRYLQLVVSASRSLERMGRAEIIELAVRELGRYLPVVQRATLVKAHVVKEVRATFSARPGLELARPETATRLANLHLAGDWTRSGWPATMEGAVRSGYKAAEAVCAALGERRTFLLPDIA